MSDSEGTTPSNASEVFGDRLAMAEAYHQILATDGIEHGLIGPREVPRLWDRHILNCAVIGEQIGDGETVVDIGSGAGLPGIPLAIARPDLRVVLVEPLLRRSSFLERTAERLGLDVTVVRGRAEEKAVLAVAGDADVVTSRAVAPLDRLARWSAPLIRFGGRMIAIKGSSATAEIAEHAPKVGQYGVAGLRVETCGEDQLSEPTTVIIGTKVESSRPSRTTKQDRSTRQKKR